MPKAYSYIRFSSAPQEFGDSIRRQTAKRDEFLEKCGLDLELDTDLDMTDKGFSGFDGSNVEKGALGAFLKGVKTGKVQKGSYLLIENLDRLSRQSLDESMMLFLRISKSGIYIVTLSDGEVFKPGKKQLSDMIPVMVELERAYKESLRKSELICDSWKGKKQSILEDKNAKKLTKWCPKWLVLSDDKTEYNVVPDKVDIINNIYKLAASGMGTLLIIKELEKNGIPAWDAINIDVGKRSAKKWYGSMIQRILTSRAVLGEYRMKNPKGCKNIEDRSKFKDTYEIISGYYPAIVDENLFYRVQGEREKRKVGRGAGRKGSVVSNLFSKIAVCGYSLEDNQSGYRCKGNNETVVYVNKGANQKYLQCSRVKNGNSGCSECRKLWRYDHFETSFLTHIRDIDVAELVGTQDDIQQELNNICDAVTNAEGRLKHIKDSLKSLSEQLDIQPQVPQLIIDRALILEQEEKDLQIELEYLNSNLKTKQIDAQSIGNIRSDLFSLSDQLYQKKGPELFEIRFKLTVLLKKVIDRIEIYTKGRITTSQKIERIREILGDEAAENMKKNIQQAGKHVLPFYIVRYKSGGSRLIITNPNNPMDLRSNIKWDKDFKILDRFQEWRVVDKSRS